MINFPTFITLFRIFVIPFVVFFIYLDFWAGDYIASILFGMACLSDYLDGHLARSWGQISGIGTFLDPIADKLLVSITLLFLVAIGRIEGFSLIPASIILMREIFVSGLREFLAGLKVNIRVSFLAKWKTSLQMVSLILLILGPTDPFELDFELIGLSFLWISAMLTVITAYDYWKIGFKKIIKTNTFHN